MVILPITHLTQIAFAWENFDAGRWTGGMQRGRVAGPLAEAGGRPPSKMVLSYSTHLALRLKLPF